MDPADKRKTTTDPAGEGRTTTDSAGVIANTCSINKTAKLIKKSKKHSEEDCCVIKIGNISYATIKLMSANNGVKVYSVIIFIYILNFYCSNFRCSCLELWTTMRKRTDAISTIARIIMQSLKCHRKTETIQNVKLEYINYCMMSRRIH